MGQLTRAALVSAGTNQAGKTNLATLANVWLNAWLRSVYESWPWPFAQRRLAAYSLAAGTTSFSLGAGSGGEALEISRIYDPINVYNSTYTTQMRARILQLRQSDQTLDETVNNPATNVGTPSRFKVRADTTTWGKWTLYPTPVPDKAYLVAFDYQVVPADLTDDAAIPVYPNDRTIIQAVFTEALKYLGDERLGEQLEVLAAMVREDRSKYGVVPGTNDKIALDPNVFL